jgi:hypothetical protein
MKTLTLKEAYAKATKIPLQCGYGLKHCFHEGNKGVIVHVTPEAESNNGEDTEETVAEIWPGPTDKYDTALLAHAFNVLPEVVEALEIVRDCLGKGGWPPDSRQTAIIEKAIAKANTVKLP